MGGREGAPVMGVGGDDCKNYEKTNTVHEISTRCARNMWILAQFMLGRCADDRQHPGAQLVSQIFTRISNKKMDQIVARISKNS